MIATQTNQRLTLTHHARNFALNEMPWIDVTIEAQIAVIDQTTGRAEIDAGLRPHAVSIGDQLASDQRRCFGGTSNVQPRARRERVAIMSLRGGGCADCEKRTPRKSGGGGGAAVATILLGTR